MASLPTEDVARVENPSMDRTIGYKLRRAQLAVFQDFIDTFTPLQLRPAEFAVLAIIADSPGQKQAAVAETLAIKPANLVSLIDGLEDRELIVRRRDEADRRSYLLHLTDTGSQFLERMYAVWHNHENRLIERLGGADARDQLIDLLDRLVDEN